MERKADETSLLVQDERMVRELIFNIDIFISLFTGYHDVSRRPIATFSNADVTIKMLIQL